MERVNTNDFMRAVQNYTNATNAKKLLISILEQGGLTEKERNAMYAATEGIGVLQGSFRSKINGLEKEMGAE